MDIGGTITLNGITARDMERVWAHKAEYDSFNINTHQIQQAPSRQGRSVYNNVPLTFSNLEGLSTITELARELEQKRESEQKPEFEQKPELEHEEEATENGATENL